MTVQRGNSKRLRKLPEACGGGASWELGSAVEKMRPIGGRLLIASASLFAGMTVEHTGTRWIQSVVPVPEISVFLSAVDYRI